MDKATGHPGKNLDAIIVGAGIAGLTAAYFLRRHRTAVLEAAPVPGGRAVSGQYGDVHYAKGAEYLGKPEGALHKLLRKLGLKAVEIPDPMDGKFDGQDYWWGEDGTDLMFIRGSSLAEFNRFMTAVQHLYDDYDEAPDIRLKGEFERLDHQTARAWFQENRFPAVYQSYYNVAARGLYGANLDEISALSYIPELGFDFEGCRPIRPRELEDLENSPQPQGEDTDAYAFPHGIGEVISALQAELADRLMTETTVAEVRRSDGRFVVRYAEASGGEGMLEAPVVILAVPAPIALQIAGSCLDAERRGLLAGIPYSSYMTAALFSDEPIQNLTFDLAVPDGWFFTDLYDSTWMQRRTGSLPPNHGWVTSAYIAPHSYQDKELLSLTDDEVLERLFADLKKLFPAVREQVTGFDIQRFTHAYPVMTPGAYGRLQRLHKLNRGGLLLAGDYLIYPTFEAACDSGYRAARLARKRMR